MGDINRLTKGSIMMYLNRMVLLSFPQRKLVFIFIRNQAGGWNPALLFLDNVENDEPTLLPIPYLLGWEDEEEDDFEEDDDFDILDEEDEDIFDEEDDYEDDYEDLDEDYEDDYEDLDYDLDDDEEDL